LEKNIKVGARVWVSFGNKKQALGYVVGLSHETKITRTKEISFLVDREPILDKNMLLLTKKIADYYCCSWGEAIETALPQPLRKGRRIAHISLPVAKRKTADRHSAMLIYDPGGKKRWDIYLEEIKTALANDKSVIVIFPAFSSALTAKEVIAAKIDIPVSLIFRREKKQLQEWINIRSEGPRVIIGTRSCVFAPVRNLGLIIIDEEHDSVYKQEQVPHYHAVNAAFIRIKNENATLILSSASPSVETFALVKKNKIEYKFIGLGQDYPQIDIVGLNQQYRRGLFHKGALLAKITLDGVFATLNAQGKVLILLNRKGFATVAYCHSCAKTIKCPRCSVNLAYHFQEDKLICHYCAYNMDLPKICPECNSGYIKFSGVGIEKVENEICRIFPQAKVARIESRKEISCDNADIFVATSRIIKQSPCVFELVVVLGIDNALNRVDFRSGEYAFSLLSGLLRFTRKRIIIQTNLGKHHIFSALVSKDLERFYREELRQRRELGFPPWRHLISIKVRGINEERVKKIAVAASEKLKGFAGYIKTVSLVTPQPARLRGSYYRHILISTTNVLKANTAIKKVLKGVSRSGIIITVDVDPI
ncbi:MAG: primosomal protein N', partial [Candidatus Omnitrophica bacterium]|nr:primosomal protein N' [Candidatus Omnitrophota bacterium]